LLHALAGHLAKAIGEAVSNGNARDLPEPMRIAPPSAASFQMFADGGYNRSSLALQRACQRVCGGSSIFAEHRLRRRQRDAPGS
jgi:hypothetical protein